MSQPARTTNELLVRELVEVDGEGRELARSVQVVEVRVTWPAIPTVCGGQAEPAGPWRLADHVVRQPQLVVTPGGRPS